MVRNIGFRRIFIFILIAGAALFWALLLRSGEGPVIQIEGVAEPVQVMVADTPELRERGLSGHPNLGKNQGMFFIFNTPGPLSFWMKEMRFSIDIIWIGPDWRVVDISENLSPETYPKTFSPSKDAQYVLEVPSGFTQAHNVTIGQLIHFKK